MFGFGECSFGMGWVGLTVALSVKVIILVFPGRISDGVLKKSIVFGNFSADA